MALLHFAAATALVLLLCLSKKVQEYIKYREALGIVISLLVFDITWGVGLSSVALTAADAPKITLQKIFTFTSSIFGLPMIFFFCILSKDVRQQIKKLFCRKTSEHPTPELEDPAAGEVSLRRKDDSFKQNEKNTDLDRVPLQRKMSEGSLASLSPGVESVQNYSVHFRPLDPIPEQQS